MKKIFKLLSFEINNRIWKLQTAVYFIIYFFIAFMIAITFAGAFPGAAMSFGLSNKLPLNSPVVLHFLTTIVGYFGILIVAPIFAQSINRDFETNFHPIIFTTPISKTTYFWVKFLGSMIITTVILSSIGFGLFTASLMPFVNQTFIAQNHCWFYISPYLSNIIPNTFIFGSIFIALIAIYKKMAPVYVANILIVIGWMIGQSFTSDLENKLLSVLIDPFGFNGMSHVVRYWSIVEESTKIIPITGYFLYNRIIWLSLGLVALLVGLLCFNPFKMAKEKKTPLSDSLKVPLLKEISVSLKPNSWKLFFQLSFLEFKMAFSNIYFLIILLAGVLTIFAISGTIGKMYGTETLPVTYHVLEVVQGLFSIFIIAIITYYTGELVWRDRDRSFYELVDSKPLSNLFLYLSKLSCMILILSFLSFVILFSGVLIQIFKGYYFFEWNLYFQQLFLYNLPSYILVSIFALFVQTIVKNKYVGHFIVILDYFLVTWLPSFGLDHHLYLIGNLPIASYSDMNKYGTSILPFISLELYWGLFHFILALLTILFWKRGEILSLKDRQTEFKIRLKPFHKRAFALALSSWILVGIFIYYNTNILNTYKSSATKDKEAATYELKYKKFETMAQPEINSVKINVDIFPETQSIKAQGVFKYKNISKKPIQTVIVHTATKANFQSLTWNKEVSLTKHDKELGVWLFDFTKPIEPEEGLELSFQLNVTPKGFENSEFSKEIVQNGTVFHNTTFFPTVGYISDLELTNEKKRLKLNLKERERIPNINDEKALGKTYISNEGTWIDFEAIVSTSKDQIAIAPGHLIKEWQAGDRRYFQYKVYKPIVNLYAFLSAKYEVTRDKWNDVDIEIYHHPNHTVDIPHMINSVKKSLDYFTKNFSPYQFKEIRIVEFPKYVAYAQSLPNTIPYSEAIGFIAKVREDDINYPFYVTAHEVAHQWWAHQVIGGKVQGATMLSESLAQYSSLMVQEKEYGREKMQKFLKYELDHYLLGRSSEAQKELPLMLNENQPYIHYHKGSLIFYALKDYLGEELVNQVLKEYIKDVAFQKQPFTRSIDLVERFKKAAPADKKYLIEDFFETITFYNNRTESVSFKKVSGKYDVEIKSNNNKVRVGALGEEKEADMDDLVDVGIFDKDNKLIYLEKHRVKSGENIFHIQVEKEPFKAGVDPINKLIDKNSDHLVKAIEVNDSSRSCK